MRVRSKSGMDACRPPAIALAIGVLAALAIAPAGAEAGQVQVPKPAASTKVVPHATTPSSAPAPAPAPVSGGGSSGSGSAEGATPAESEASQPGAGLPGNERNPYPSKLPHPSSSACSYDCLVEWHDYYTLRAYEVGDNDPEAAAELNSRRKAVDNLLSDLRGQDPDDDEPVAPAGETSIFGTSGDAAQAQDAAASTGPPVLARQIGTFAALVVPDAISGADPRWRDPTDLGTVDLYTPIADFVGLSGSPVLGALALFGVGPLADAKSCPKKNTADGKVAVCPN